MLKMIADVRAFHERFRCNIGDPADPKIFNGPFRSAFIREEAGETLDALRDEDAEGMIDGLCDLLYVTIGSAIEFGIDLSIFSFVHRVFPSPCADLIIRKAYWSDVLKKISDGAAEAIDSNAAIVDVTAHLVVLIFVINSVVNAWGLDIRPFWDEVQRANMSKVPSGSINVKTIKPPGWTPPNHAPILAAQYGLS